MEPMQCFTKSYEGEHVAVDSSTKVLPISAQQRKAVRLPISLQCLRPRLHLQLLLHQHEDCSSHELPSPICESPLTKKVDELVLKEALPWPPALFHNVIRGGSNHVIECINYHFDSSYHDVLPESAFLNLENRNCGENLLCSP
ncbi:hypothetical protein QQ045_032774 [Rhodiola kirilowii]